MNFAAAIQGDEGQEASASREIEIKLEADARLLRRALTLPALAGAIVETARPRKLVSVYFDTADDALDRRGFALRVRKIGARRVLTLKWTLADAGPFARGEAEAPLAGDAPDLATMADLLAPVVGEELATDLVRTVIETAGGQPLVARFETHIRRRLAVLDRAGADIEVAIDDGEIVAGDRVISVCEAELELRSGDAAALFELAGELVDEGFRLGAAAKSQRGYRLARGEPAPCVRAIHPQLGPSDTAEDAIRAVVRSTLSQFVANWPAFQETGAPEAIHQMRVALRRLRSGLALFEKALPNAGFAAHRAQAKRIATALGAVRDQDVFIALVEDGPLRMFGADASFEALLGASRALRAEACRVAQALIESPEASRFVLDLEGFVARRAWRNQIAVSDLARLSAPASQFGARVLDIVDRKALKRGRKLVDLPPDERHEARIALKNLRYASDFFSSLFGDPRAVKRFHKSLGALQDDLGVYNDAVVARENAQALEERAGPAASRAAGVVMGWCGRGALESDAHLARDWKRYRKARRFWR